MRGRSVLGVLVLVVLLGGAAAFGSPRVAARSVACPDRESVTVGDLLALASRRGWTGYWGSNPRAHACFGAAPITIRAFSNWPDGIGGTSTSGITPGVFEWPQLYLFESAREVYRGYGAGRFYGVVVPPRFGRVENTYHRMWVEVTARFEDPYADRCRGWAEIGKPMSRKDAVKYCRDTLVLTSIRAISSAPPTTSVASPVPPTGRDVPPWWWVLLVPAAGLGVWLGWRRFPGRGSA
jgi:hypothetical protein